MNQVFSLLGKLLLVLAFIATAAEVGVQFSAANANWTPSSGHIWAYFAPDSAAAFLKANPGVFWQGVLKVPAWAFCGIPGFILVYAFHDQQAGEDSELEASLFLYDELIKQVKSGDYEGYDETDPHHDGEIDIADPHLSEGVAEDADSAERDFLLGPSTRN